MVVVVGLSGGRRRPRWLWWWQWVVGKLSGGVGENSSQTNNRNKKEKKGLMNSGLKKGKGGTRSD